MGTAFLRSVQPVFAVSAYGPKSAIEPPKPRSVSETRTVSEWQPMATAPKDSSEILVCRAGAEDVFELIAWNPILRAWLDRNAEPYEGATHWLAIPPTPKH